MFRLLTQTMLVVFAVFAFLSLSPVPLAGQNLVDGLNSLSAGGNTIAGPGVVTGVAPLNLAVWRSTFPISVCITATNLGSAVVSTEFVPGPPDSLVVGKGKTISNCKQDVTSVLVKCAGNPPQDDCRVVWRVDKVD